MITNNNTKTGGIGFFSALGIAFIVLKLCNVIDWAWWIVLMPIWIPLALVVVCYIVLFILEVIPK